MKNKYKISISIFFGIISFFMNFYTINFPFGEYTATILIGLLFPMLITLSWGWKYGLLSAIAGGCQTMWWLWGPSNGYAIFFVVPPFTLWIIWHGIFAEIRKKQKNHKWWLSMYIVEIPFRILSSISLLTLSRWAITLNPPPWSWCSNAPNTIPMHFSIFVTIKQAAVGFIILLLADVLLNIKHVRIFLKLKEYVDSKKTGYIISTFLLLGCLFWLFDSVIYSFVFHKGSSFFDLIALNIPDYNVFIRTVFFIFCLVSGLITSRILRRQREGEIALKENEEKFRSYIENAPFGAFVADEKGNYVDVNKAACRITGYSRVELLNKNLVELIPPEDQSYVKKHFETVVKTGISTGDMSFIKKDGSKNTWTVDAVKLSDNRFLGFVADITDRKQAEEELKKHREHLEELIKERTKELEEKNEKLEELNELFVGREFRIKELKDKVKELEGKNHD